MTVFSRQKHKEMFQRPAKGPVENIQSMIIKVQKKTAKWMEHRTEDLHQHHWVMILGSFVLLTAGYNSYLISRSIFSNEHKVFSITSIREPISLVETSSYKNQKVDSLDLIENKDQSLKQLKNGTANSISRTD